MFGTLRLLNAGTIRGGRIYVYGGHGTLERSPRFHAPTCGNGAQQSWGVTASTGETAVESFCIALFESGGCVMAFNHNKITSKMYTMIPEG